MNTTTNIKTLLMSRIREVTTTDTATGETTTVIKAVNLKAGDFSSREEWKAYSRRLLDLGPVMLDVAKAFDSKDDAFTTARKTAVESLQGVVNLLSNMAGFEKFNVQKKDVNYIVRLAYGRKVDKDGKTTTVTVKSKSALQTLVEDVFYFHLNGKAVPGVKLSAATEAALAKASEQDNKSKAEVKTVAA